MNDHMNELGRLNKIYSNNFIQIRTSKFKNSGYGAFSTKFIDANKVLGEYIGEILSEKEQELVSDRSYIFEVCDKRKGNFYIDALNEETSNWTRFINGCKNKRQIRLQNSKFHQKDKKIYVKSIKNISPGDEIVADYGDEYW